MAKPSEEERAAAYRQRYTRRVAFNARLEAALAGNPTAAAATEAKWQPIIDLNEDGGMIEDGVLEKVPGVANQDGRWPDRVAEPLR